MDCTVAHQAPLSMGILQARILALLQGISQTQGSNPGFLHCGRILYHLSHLSKGTGLPGGSTGKESTCSAGDLGSIPGLGRSPGEGNGNPLQYSCLGNPMDRGAWQATVHGVTRVRRNLVTKPPSKSIVVALF